MNIVSSHPRTGSVWKYEAYSHDENIITVSLDESNLSMHRVSYGQTYVTVIAHYSTGNVERQTFPTETTPPQIETRAAHSHNDKNRFQRVKDVAKFARNEFGKTIIKVVVDKVIDITLKAIFCGYAK